MNIQNYGYYVKLPHKKILALKPTKKIRLRYFQVLLFILAYSNGGSKPIGTVRKSGRHFGCLRYKKDFIFKARRFLNMSKRQLYQYLQEMRQENTIIKITPKFSQKPTLNLNPRHLMASKPHDKYTRFSLKGCGTKGRDIQTRFQNAINENRHPTKTEKFKIPVSRQTQKYRQIRDKQCQPPSSTSKKTAQVLKRRPFLDLRSRKNAKKQENKQSKKHDRNRISLRVPWWKCRKMSEFQRLCFGLAPQQPAIFHGGRAFQLDTSHKNKVYIEVGLKKHFREERSGPERGKLKKIGADRRGWERTGREWRGLEGIGKDRTGVQVACR